ncbi:MAG: SDR family NAD(P)-dependent oxidoreductase, partial [Desulfobacterales bacterium]
MKSNFKKSEIHDPIAIIGMGCLFAKSPGLKEYWRMIYRGVDGIIEVPQTHWGIDDYFDPDPKKPDHVYCKRGGFLPPIMFDPTEFGIPPSTLEATDSSQLLGLIAAQMALQDAGYLHQNDFDKDRTSVILGVTGTQELVIPLSSRLGHPIWRRALEDSGVSPEKTRSVMQKISDAYVSWQENSFPGLLGNVVAGRICNRLDLGGTNCVVDAACASSLGAIHLALMELSAGHSDLVVTGGVDTLNDIFMHMCFSKTLVLSQSGDARPFSKDADGTVLGEGVGLLVLKRLKDAQRDNDRIYAVIKAIGSSSDGKSQSIYAPRIEGQARALQAAYQKAGLNPHTVELLEAHGTGTRVGDKVEFEALCHVFKTADDISQNHANGCALGSVKSMIGHTKAAAGSAGLIKTALALYNKVLPPTLKVEHPDPELKLDQSPFHLSTDRRPWFSQSEHPRRAGVSAFGFGGSNFHMVLEEYSPSKPEAAWDGSVDILALSGKSHRELVNRLTQLKETLTPEVSETDIALQAAKSRSNFSAQSPLRLLLLLEKSLTHSDPVAELRALCEKAAKLLEQNRDRSIWHQNNIFFGSIKPQQKPAFLFPGQGSQYVNMGRDVACIFPEALNTIELANQRFDRSRRLSDYIYPRPGQTETEKSRQTELLRRTEIAQPAIGAVSLAMLRVLEIFGITPAAVCGHSFGELTALCAAGWITEKTFFDLAIDRGKFMAAAGRQNNRDKGGMLAAMAPLDDITSIIRQIGADILLANRNSPNQGVLSGTSEAVLKAETICKPNGFSAIRLPVSAAFHSPLVKDAQAPFQSVLNNVKITPSSVPVLSNTSGDHYPQDSDQAKALLGRHLLQPVNFLKEIENIYRSGIRTFIEIGPRTVLSGLVKSIIADNQADVLPLDASSGKRFGLTDLAQVLCRLAASGHTVDLTKWETAPQKQRKNRMRIPILGTNYRVVDTPAVSPPDDRETGQLKAQKRVRPEDYRHNQKPKDHEDQIEHPKIIQRDEMKKNNPALADAFQVVQEGLKSMQALHKVTAEAHQKFLETQAEASRTLQVMVEKTEQLAQTALGLEPRPRSHRETGPGQPVSETRPAPEETQRVEGKHLPDDAAPPSVKSDIEEITHHILEVVSQLTGYPDEMLGMDMDIESDLGIDSIKRVEILSTLEEKVPDLPTIPPEMLGRLKTLGQIAAYLAQSSSTQESDAGTVLQREAPAPSEMTAAENLPTVERKVIRIIEDPLQMGAAKSIPRDRRVYVIDDDSGLSEMIAAKFRALKIDAVCLPYSDFSSQNDLSNLGGLIIPYLPETSDWLKEAFRITRMAAPGLLASAQSGGALFATITRIDGAFGFKQTRFRNPEQGGLAGLAKTAALEWSGVTCHAFDIDGDTHAHDDISQMVVTQLLNSDPSAPVEIGLDSHLKPGFRYRLELESKPFPEGETNITPQDVFVITGGARGVTAAAAMALAQEATPKLALLGRSPEPRPEPDWLYPLTDEASIKKEILAHEFDDGPASPLKLEKKYKAWMANREISMNLQKLERLGSRATYYTVDIRDIDPLKTVIETVLRQMGPVTGLIHGAGLLADHLITDKTTQQFERVFDTKIKGLLNLLDAIDAEDLRYLVLFSSIAARMGNRGQVDYAMANEVLNKVAQFESRRRPNCRVISVNWGPWDGGMVSPALKREFAKKNVDLIPMTQGGRYLLNEMRGETNDAVEVIIGANMTTVPIPKPTQPPTEKLLLTCQRELELDLYPILKSHMLDQTPVVPFALISEWLGHSALHENPGLVLQGLDDLRLFNGIKLDQKKKTIRMMAGKIKRKGRDFEV